MLSLRPLILTFALWGGLTPRVVLSAVLASGMLASGAWAQGRPAGVSTQTIDMRQMSETVAAFGQIVSGRESAVAARVPGVVTSVAVRVGDQVAQGAVLAQLDTERLDIQLARAQADIAIAEAGIAVASARLERAETALRRTESLAARSTASQAQLDDRAGAYAEALGSQQQAQARILSAEVALRQALYDLDRAVIRAPFGGTVLEVTTEVGQFIQTGNVVGRILDTSTLEVEANVPSRYIGALQVDLPVQARTDAGNTLTMTLRAILPTEFTSTRTRPVRFDLTGDTATTAVGQAVTLDLPVSAPRDMLVVPKDALVQAGGGWRVFVNDDGKASPRSVTIGAAIGDSFAVLSGLAPGDEVVVRGNERLRPGQAISTGRGRPGGEGRPGGGRPDSGGSGRPAAEGTGGQPREQGQAARTAPARAAATTAQRTSTGG